MGASCFKAQRQHEDEKEGQPGQGRGFRDLSAGCREAPKDESVHSSQVNVGFQAAASTVEKDELHIGHGLGGEGFPAPLGSPDDAALCLNMVTLPEESLELDTSAQRALEQLQAAQEALSTDESGHDNQTMQIRLQLRDAVCAKSARGHPLKGLSTSELVDLGVDPVVAEPQGGQGCTAGPLLLATCPDAYLLRPNLQQPTLARPSGGSAAADRGRPSARQVRRPVVSHASDVGKATGPNPNLGTSSGRGRPSSCNAALRPWPPSILDVLPVVPPAGFQPSGTASPVACRSTASSFTGGYAGSRDGSMPARGEGAHLSLTQLGVGRGPRRQLSLRVLSSLQKPDARSAAATILASSSPGSAPFLGYKRIQTSPELGGPSSCNQLGSCSTGSMDIRPVLSQASPPNVSPLAAAAAGQSVAIPKAMKVLAVMQAVNNSASTGASYSGPPSAAFRLAPQS